MVGNPAQMSLAGRLTVLLALSIALSSCGLQSELVDRATNAGVVARSPATALSGTTLDGRFDLGALRRHVIVIDWWGSWCGPCRLEQPELNRLARRFAPRGFAFLASTSATISHLRSRTSATFRSRVAHQQPHQPQRG